MAMAEKKQFPSEKLDQYMLRFPDGMRDRLKEAAESNKRSMNAEIIARLEASLAPPIQLQFNLPDELGDKSNLFFEAMAKQSAEMIGRLQTRVAELEAQTPFGDQPFGFIYVALDANGNPISWDEIREHLKAIRQAGDFDVWSMQAIIHDAKLEKNEDREAQAREVANFYRRQKRKKP